MGYIDDNFGDNPDDLGRDFGSWPGGGSNYDNYDPWSDPNNYDPNGQFIGDGAWDGSGNYVGGGSDPFGKGISYGSIQKMLNGFGGGVADASKLLGDFSKGEKANRLSRGDLTQRYDQLMLQAQQGRNSNESDALKKLQQTEYIKNGGSPFTAPTLSINGRQIQTPDLGFGPKATTETEKQGAGTLQSMVMDRLKPGGSYTPTPVGDYANPGVAENIGSYGAAGLGGVGAILQMMNGGRDNTPTGAPGGGASALTQGLGAAGAGLSIAKMVGSGSGGVEGGAGGVGQALGRFGGPAIGAAAGIYGLAQNKGGMSNVMNGLGTGASIGTMVMPGIGTAVGAGVGALYGVLQNVFTVTQKEKDGRKAQETITSALGSQSTPQQQAEAKQAGWADPRQALSLIVIRDSLIHSGVNPQMASQQAMQIKSKLYSSTGKGPDAVREAFAPVSSLFSGGMS